MEFGPAGMVGGLLGQGRVLAVEGRLGQDVGRKRVLVEAVAAERLGQLENQHMKMKMQFVCSFMAWTNNFGASLCWGGNNAQWWSQHWAGSGFQSHRTIVIRRVRGSVTFIYFLSRNWNWGEN